MIIFFSIILILLPITLISGPFLSGLSILSLGGFYLYNYIKNFKVRQNSNKILILFLLFNLYILFGSILGNNKLLSLETSLFYIRFILFSFAIFYLLQLYEKKIIKYSFIIMIFTILFVCVDSIFQYFFSYNLFGLSVYANDNRISGIFNSELILGSYIIRLLPILITLYFLYIKIENIKYNILILLFYLIILFTVLISGERVIFINLIMITITYFLISQKKIFFLSFIVLLTLGLFFIIINSDPIKSRFIDRTRMDLGLFTDKTDLRYFSETHEEHIFTAYKIFQENILIGKGVKTFRAECKKHKKLYYHGCSTHPHNTYMQLLSEIGLIGTIPIIILFFFCLYKYFKIIFIINLKKNKNINYLQAKSIILVSFIITLMPFLPSPNFFGSYINIFFYLPFGYYLFINTKIKEG